MRITNLKVKNFRGIKSADLFFKNHVVLVGDNNIGKSTVLESIDLVLGPDRLNRNPIIDEHDFFEGRYQKSEAGQPVIEIEVMITSLNSEQLRRFNNYIEWWDNQNNIFISEISKVDKAHIEPALRVTFIGKYEEEDDDFNGATFFSRSLTESENPQVFSKKDKQLCGFLYLRSIRTGSRALSLEKGSLLDIILRIKELRPQMWEKILEPLNKFEVASEGSLGIVGILNQIEDSLRKYVPKEWGVSPHLKISNLTREHLRKIITAFIATGEGSHAAPFYRQGTGTINLLVLAMLSMIAEEKQNVIFAMEEVETAIPPYTQKRVVHEIKKLSAQSFFTSHSPYVLEEFDMEDTCILHRSNDGNIKRLNIELPDGIKSKRYKQDFRTKFCEGLLARRVLIAEGATEAIAIPAIARKLSELNDQFVPLEALGICTINAEGEGSLVALCKLFKSLGKEVFVTCDLQDESAKKLIELHVDYLFMHDELGFEDLVMKNVDHAAIVRFAAIVKLPSHIKSKYAQPFTDPKAVLTEYFLWSKGSGGITDFLLECSEAEIPSWLKSICHKLRNICQPKIEESEPAV